MAKYAMLLSGGLNKTYNANRYRNDLEFAYKVLQEDCGYDEKYIECFYADGKQLTYAGRQIKTLPAEKEALIQHLERLSVALGEEDVFTLVVSNHGGKEENGRIYLWGNESIRLEDLAKIMDKMKARKHLILEECYAGNILDMKIQNSCIVTANDRGCVSYGALENSPYEYDEFFLHFWSFIHGQYPDGIKIEGGNNNLIEAHKYTLEHDSFSPFNPMRISCGVEEIPQIKTDLHGKVSL